MNVVEELTGSEQDVDRSYIERRIADWRRRIARLYADVSHWLPDRWTATEGGSVSMHGKLMQRLDLPARILPILSLRRDGGAVGRMEPRGLWIIGANGRMDMVLPGRHLLFVDRSETLTDAEWFVAPIEARRDQKPLSQNLIRTILA